MKTRTKIIAGLATVTIAAVGIVAYNTSWGQKYLGTDIDTNVVVRTYQATEDFATSTAETVENFFVDKLFSKDGESVQETKDRLKNN